MARITSHFDVFAALSYGDALELERVRQLLDARAGNRARRFGSADDLRSDEKRHLVYETCIEKRARDLRAAFNQHTLQRLICTRLTHRTQIRVTEHHHGRFRRGAGEL